MTAQELWNEYCSRCHVDADTPYEAWSFGDDPDTLSALVLKGIKTATSSLYDLYALEEDETMPQAGDISILLNGSGEAVCIIQNTRVYRTKFSEVSSEQAFREGEGDRTLPYWRRVHEAFFQSEAEEYGITFSDHSEVLCEEFEVVYRP